MKDLDLLFPEKRKTLVILTGHTKGLGKALLDLFLEREEIWLIGVSRSKSGIIHNRFLEICQDLSDYDAIQNHLPSIFPKESFERYILINNAAWIGEIKPVGNLEPAELRKALNLNLLTPMLLCNAFMAAYAREKGEKIICNISSGAAHKPLAGWAEYCTSKAGLAMFSQVLAEDQKGKAKVYSLAPGIVDTGMQAEIRQSNEADFPSLPRFMEYKQGRHLSSPEEVGLKIVFMLNHPDLFPEVIQDVRNVEFS